MASFVDAGPSIPVVESVRVDQVTPRARTSLRVRMIVAIVVAFIMLIPVIWLTMTAFKSRPDAVAAPPKVLFTPSLDGLVALLTTRNLLPPGELAKLQADP
jgi:multiple sugar transport system permease protein